MLNGLIKLLGFRRAKLTRLQVFKKLNHERQYQQERWKDHIDDNVVVTVLTEKDTVVPEPAHEVGAWISFMETYLQEARNLNAKGEDALLKIRCVAALGVACLEQHGCPDRPPACTL